MDPLSIIGTASSLFGGGSGSSTAPASPAGPVTFGNVTQGGSGLSTKAVAVIGIAAVTVLGLGLILFLARRKS
jgi:hypothetical protein